MRITTAYPNVDDLIHKLNQLSNQIMEQFTSKERSLVRLSVNHNAPAVVEAKRSKVHGVVIRKRPELRAEQKMFKPSSEYERLVKDSSSVKPLIGVLTDYVGTSIHRPFGIRTPFMRQLVEQGQHKGNFIIFRPNDIRVSEEQVVAYSLDKNGQWKRQLSSLPDVVYNRLLNRKLEKSNQHQRLRRMFIDLDIPVFNWSYFNKTDVYQLVHKNKSLYKHIPEYFINPSQSQLQDMLSRHSFVFLKPTDGSLGIGIFKITSISENRFQLRYRQNDVNYLFTYNSLKDVMVFISRKVGSKLSQYFVQRGIDLIELEECPVDFRFHMHRDGEKGWRIAGIGAKKAGNGSITTHTRSGGEIMPPEQVLRLAFGKSASRLFNQAKLVSIQLAQAIEKHNSHLIGEIGFDLGIDKRGRIWMFEANSKPGRSIFKHPALKVKGKASINYIVNHCVYLGKVSERLHNK